MDDSIRRKINEHWSKHSKNAVNQRSRWWQIPYIISKVNERVSGTPHTVLSQGLVSRVKELSKGKMYERGISVGCGSGQKEMRLIQQGIVGEFILYELAVDRIKTGKKLAEKLGLANKLKFIEGDAFSMEVNKESYDFVHWNNSLHHMMDTEKAIAWSYDMLKEGGMFYMDDYVGPSRLQWSDKMLEIAEKVRGTLPDLYLEKPAKPSGGSLLKRTLRLFDPRKKPKKMFPRTIAKPTIEQMLSIDPSEAADSEKILQSIQKYFPDAQIQLTGGVIYFLALDEILCNFDEKRDKNLLSLLMLMDDLCVQLGENLYATALAFKVSGNKPIIDA